VKIVELRDIHRSMGRGEEVLHGVDLAIEPGEVVALLGSNGAGKTTLLRIALGLLHPHRGTVKLFGLGFQEAAVEIKRRLGYVSEDQILPSFMTVDGVFEVHRALFPTWDRSLESRLRHRFNLVYGRTQISSLSKGQKRQVALLCAVAHRPELLILDEPASGLDPRARIEIRNLLRRLGELNKTVIVSSHILPELSDVCTRVGMIEKGVLIVDGYVNEVMKKARESQMLEVRVTEQPERAAAMIEQLDGIAGVSMREQTIEVTLKQDVEDYSFIPQALFEAGFQLTQFREEEVNLETAFMELTRGKQQ